MNDSLLNFLKAKQILVMPDESADERMQLWLQWYKGKVDKFHEYKVYTGKESKKAKRKTLNMPSRVCQKWADLLLNEKVEINVENEKITEFLRNVLTDSNFYVRGNNLIERAFALGGGYLVEYFDGRKVKLKYISQEMMYPITYDSGRLIECAFVSQKTVKKKKYYYIEVHKLDDDGKYVIENILGEIQDKGIVEATEDIYEVLDIEREIITNSDIPTFQKIAPNVSNREDFNSAYGVSVFSGSEDICETIDIIFDSYSKEFLLGKKRLFVEDSVSNVNWDKDGNPIKVFDPNDEVFYSVPQNEEKGQPITESNMSLRVAEHDQAMQTQLNLLSEKVGLGPNAFKWEDGNVTTATQVISENSEMYRTLKKHELVLNDALIGMVKGLIVINNLFGKEKLSTDVDISINFDDSIIEDTAEQQRRALLELNVGLISKIQYYKDVYKMTDEQAKEYFKKMQEQIAQEQPPAKEEPDVEV